MWKQCFVGCIVVLDFSDDGNSRQEACIEECGGDICKRLAKRLQPRPLKVVQASAAKLEVPAKEQPPEKKVLPQALKAMLGLEVV